MKKTAAIIVVLILIAGAAIFVQARNRDGNNTAMTQSGGMRQSSGEAAVQTDKVSISNFKFSPAHITVKKGTTVTWTNQDSIPHTVTADSGSGPDSPRMTEGKTYSYTYEKTGSFPYHCDIHEDMKAIVTVTD